MSVLLTLHQNMNGAAPYNNPNLWLEDGSMIQNSPVVGGTYTMKARVKNSGTTPINVCTVEFYIIEPSSNCVYTDAPFGTATLTSTLAVNQEHVFQCIPDWTVQSTYQGHHCLAAVVYADSPVLASPDTSPGVHVQNTNDQVAQHNITVQPAPAGSSGGGSAPPPGVASGGILVKPKGLGVQGLESFNQTLAGRNADFAEFYFVVNPSYNPNTRRSTVKLRRLSLASHQDALASKGLNINAAEAPTDVDLFLHDISDHTQLNPSDELILDPSQSYRLGMQIYYSPNAQAGSLALYRADHYEDGRLVGGVTHILAFV